MRRRTRILTVALAAALACATGSVGLRANGAEFFEAQNDGRVVLYYFGNVKDSKGNVLDKLMVTITAKNAGLTFPVPQRFARPLPESRHRQVDRGRRQSRRSGPD